MAEMLVQWSSRLAAKLLAGKKANARKKGLAFTLTAADVERIWTRAGGCCEVSGIRFSEKRFEAFVQHPFYPSLDKIRPRGGYTPANTRLVCVAVNFAMGEWGEDVLTPIVDGINAKRGRLPPEVLTRTPKADQDWIDAQQRKIDEAERIAGDLSGEELRKQRRRIAGFKATLTRGQEGAASAGKKAAEARRKAKQEWIDLRQRLIDQAEAVAAELSGSERKKQRGRVARLKAILTLGPKGLSRAGQIAARTKRLGRQTRRSTVI